MEEQNIKSRNNKTKSEGVVENSSEKKQWYSIWGL